ncbi:MULTISPECIES: phosphotransferase family protein [unclassified Haladaptatus]|uniref:phosphotransferase family protein n=1 Tax=unclassified Haladaptatus TaxID=2622732 RepID=UPI0023E8239F|nr:MULTISPECIES: phosphotransferase [unclassified Haladaptatus]
MFASLGYVDELIEAANRGDENVRLKVGVDGTAVEQVAQETFPGADSVVVHEDSMAGDGGVTYTFTIPETDARYVAKFAPDDATSLVKGAGMYRALAKVARLPVPAVYAVERDPSVVDVPYSIVEYVPGDELTSISQFKSFSRDTKRTLVREMGRTLGLLHSETRFDYYGDVAVSQAGNLRVDSGVTDWRNYYREEYTSNLDDGSGSPVDDLAERATDCFADAAADIEPDTGPVLLHGDFTPDNLIFEDNRVRAVLDWEHATAGCRAKEAWEVEEAIVNLFTSERVRADLREALWSGYAETASVTENFRAMKDLFAIGAVTRVGRVHAACSDVVEDLDEEEFRVRAERELERRLRRIGVGSSPW